MNEREIWQRTVASEGGVPVRTVTAHSDLHDRLAVQAAMSRVSEAQIYVDDSTGVSVEAIIRAVKKRGNIKLVIIDYLQLLTSHKQRENRTQEVTEITRSLKIAASKMRIPFIVLSQLNRDGPKANRQPELYDLRESGSIEQDANIVIFLHSDAEEIKSAIRHRRPSMLRLILAKQRSGPKGAINLLFDAARMQMTETTEAT
jgi:replicative DNA helicase